MSQGISPEIFQIRIKAGTLISRERLVTKMNAAMSDATTAWVNRMIVWYRQHVPRSKKSHPNKLQPHMIEHTARSRGPQVRRGGGTTAGRFIIDADVPHAGHVNEMNPPVHWTPLPGGGRPTYHFFEKALEHGRPEMIERIIKRELRKSGVPAALGMSAGKAFNTLLEVI